MPPSEPSADSLFRRCVFGSLLVWVAGVQVHELFATIGMGATLLFVLVHVVVRRDLSVLRHAFDNWKLLLLFVAWAMLGPMLGGHGPNPEGLGRLLDWCALPAAVYAGGVLSTKQRRALLIVGATTLVVSCLVAGLQHFGLWPPRDFFAPLHELGLPTHRVYEAVPGASTRFMGGGLLFHRLKFAHVSGLVIVFLAVVSLTARGRFRLAAAAVALLGAASSLVFSQTRAAALATIASVALMLALRGRLRLSWPVAGMGVALAAAVALTPGLQARVLEVVTDRANPRVQLNRAGLIAIGQEPWTGLGWWQLDIGDHSPPGTFPWVRNHPGRAHDQFITLGAEIGLVGLALFLLVMTTLARRALARDRAVLASGLLAYLGVLSLFHDPLFHAEMSMATILALALMVAPRLDEGEKSVVDTA